MNCQQPGAIVLLISLLKILSAGADGDQLVSADQMDRILDESASDTAVEQSGGGGTTWPMSLGICSWCRAASCFCTSRGLPADISGRGESMRRASYGTPRCCLSIIPL